MKPMVWSWKESPEQGPVDTPIGPAYVYTGAKPGNRFNEDGALLVRLRAGRVLIAVADGMGGGPRGEEASRIALETLGRRASEERRSDILGTVVEGFKLAHEAVSTLARGAATTMTAAIVAADRATFVHTGDSGGMVVDRYGDVISQTTMMSPSGYLVAADVLTERQAMMHPHRNIVTHVVGDGELNLEVRPDVPLEKGSKILLASDGLLDVLDTRRIAKELSGAKDLALAVGAMVSEVHRLTTRLDGPTMKADDVTIVAFQPSLSLQSAD